jgi:hypothetical protein
MNIQLTKKQIVGLYESLLGVGNLKGVRFSYVVAKNTLALETEVSAIQKMYAPSKEFTVYDEERIKLAESHSKKENGEAKKYIENGVAKYDIEDKNKFIIALKELQAKHEKAIQAREAQLKEIDKILEEKIEVDLQTIHINDIPEDIDAKQMTNIFIIVTDKRLVN